MYGFWIMYTQGPGSQMILISNSASRGRFPVLEALGEDLAALVNQE